MGFNLTGNKLGLRSPVQPESKKDGQGMESRFIPLLHLRIEQGSSGTALFAKIGSHVQYHKALIALINTITTDILISWYLMAKYSDGSRKSLLSLAIKVGRLKVFPNKGDIVTDYCED